MSKVAVFIQCQLVTIVSTPWSRKMNSGRRLTAKAVLTPVLTWVTAQLSFWGFGSKVVMRGYKRRPKISMRLVEKIRAVGCIAATWICTKSFWFLRPTDELLSFRSASEPRS